MNAKEIVKVIMEEKGITQAIMSDRLGISRQAMWDRLNNKKNKDLSVAVLDDMLRVLDCKIVVLPREARTPKGGYEVE